MLAACHGASGTSANTLRGCCRTVHADGADTQARDAAPR